jgi:hypothetical protein
MSTTTIRAGLAACTATLALAGVAFADGLPAPHQHSHPRHATIVAARGGHAKPAASARGATEQRPRESLFMSNAQLAALEQPYNTCVSEKAPAPAATTAQPGQMMAAVPITPRYERAYDQAEAACRGLEPLPPWQYDASNPSSMAFVNAVVSCLREHGVSEVQAQPAGPGEDRNGIALGGSGNDPSSITLGLDDMTLCEHAAAAAR